jgi:hypothetical protein
VTLSWPRVIAVASGTFGAALIVAFAAQLSVSNSVRAHTLDSPAEFLALICGCLFLFLAFPLFTGREWARRALLLTIYCSLAALAISFSLMVSQQLRSPSTSHTGLRFVIGACVLVCVLTPPAFVLAALHHADVRRAFQPKSASNQAMQPTASPRTASLSDD